MRAPDHAFEWRGLHRVSASPLASNEASLALRDRPGSVHGGTSRDLGFVGGAPVDVERYALPADERDGAAAVVER